MKRFLYFSILSIFVLSCSEYDDDGLPSEPGNIVITNPDGSKKVKRITTNMDLPNSSFEDEGFSFDMSNYQVINFAQDSYSHVDSLYVSFDFDMPDMPEFPDMDFPSESAIVTSTEMRDNVPTEVITIYDMPEAVNERQIFEYENNRIVSHTFYDGNQVVFSSTFTYNGDNIVFNKQFSDSQIGDETMTFQLQDGQIMSFTYSPSDTNAEYNINLTRSGVNITQAQINMTGIISDIVYSYDNANIYLHNLGNEINDSRTSMELISLTSTDFDDTPNIIIDHVESLVRNATKWGSHNLTGVMVNGQTFMTANHVYDSENYPIELQQRVRAITDFGIDTETILTGNIYYYE